jgi:8-oxo-dGTP diphosphatase
LPQAPAFPLPLLVPVPPNRVSSRSPLPVVAAVLTAPDGRVLLAQRPAHKHLGRKWEFPGGKIEPGETPAAALRRELHEELGCETVVTAPLPRFEHDYGTVLIAMIPFICTLAPGSPPPQAREHLALAWVAVSDLRHYDLAPADWPVVAALEALAAEDPPGAQP